MAKFEKKRQENNKNNNNNDNNAEKHTGYRFKVLHNGFKPEDREKMLKAVYKDGD